MVWGVSFHVGKRLRGAVSVVDSRAGDVAREPTQAGDFAVSASVNASLQLLTPQAAGQQIRRGTDSSSGKVLEKWTKGRIWVRREPYR